MRSGDMSLTQDLADRAQTGSGQGLLLSAPDTRPPSAARLLPWPPLSADRYGEFPILTPTNPVGQGQVLINRSSQGS